MHIDWVTVTAQIANFLVLVWLLRRFLYRPVLDAMARREQRIAARLDEAREREESAALAAQRFEAESAALDQRREEILASARAESEEEKRRLLETARSEVAEARERWRREVALEREAFLAELRRRGAEGVQAVARAALRDLADADLEERVIDTFIARLRTLDTDARAALAGDGEGVRIRTAFELPPAGAERLAAAVRDEIAPGIAVSFERDAALVCGIELIGGGQRLDWGLARYLDALADRVEVALAPLAAVDGEDQAGA